MVGMFIRPLNTTAGKGITRPPMVLPVAQTSYGVILGASDASFFERNAYAPSGVKTLKFRSKNPEKVALLRHARAPTCSPMTLPQDSPQRRILVDDTAVEERDARPNRQ